MSHTVKVDNITINNVNALQRAVQNMGLQIEESNSLSLYNGTYNVKKVIQLPGWKYKIGITEDGEIIYDNYNGSWGNYEELHRLLKEYSAAQIEDQFMERGQMLMRTEAENGDIKLQFPDSPREIIVKEDGRIELEGFYGVGCTETAEEILEIFGGQGSMEEKLDLNPVPPGEVLVEVDET